MIKAHLVLASLLALCRLGRREEKRVTRLLSL